jgi:dihydroorotate dehydrogenase
MRGCVSLRRSGMSLRTGSDASTIGFVVENMTENVSRTSLFLLSSFPDLMKIPPAIYEKFVRPMLFRLDPETAHELAMYALGAVSRSRLLLKLISTRRDPRLEKRVFGLKFANPVGLAAGFDKNAVALPAWQALGFGFIEAGTVTARAQPGNVKPRIFRFPEQKALVNWLGFNNDGADAVAQRLGVLKKSGLWPDIPVGINLGKSKVTPIEEATGDYLLSFERLQHFGDYFVLNVSSPNTPNLRKLQDAAALGELFANMQRRNPEHKPLLVKIAPDLEWEPIEEILALVKEHEIAGIIATNTTIDHSAVESPDGQQQGGLSGEPLRKRSTEIVKFIASKSDVPVIAAGGIMDADGAMEKFDAGAALVQLYTGYVYRGPALIGEICERLLARAK